MKAPEAELGPLRDQGISETASSVGKRLFPSSGAMDYRVVCHGGAGLSRVVVNAATGDEAATKGLQRFPGTKVVSVTPAGDAVVISDQEAA